MLTPEPVYYSLQFPTTKTFSQNSNTSSVMDAMKELKDLHVDLFEELTKDNYLWSNTIIQQVSKKVNLSFFHNIKDIDDTINYISELLSADQRFGFSFSESELTPAQDSKFFRGCLKISS